jgi:hypothetical protein
MSGLLGDRQKKDIGMLNRRHGLIERKYRLEMSWYDMGF